jgi:hypothetical protein
LSGLEKVHSGSIILHHLDTYRYRRLDKNGMEKPLSGFNRIAHDNVDHVRRVSREAIKSLCHRLLPPRGCSFQQEKALSRLM